MELWANNVNWSFDIAFLKRRKVYALIEKGRYEEAKNAPVLWAKYWSTLGRVPEYFR